MQIMDGCLFEAQTDLENGPPVARNSFGGSIGDPGAAITKGKLSLGPEISWVFRNVRDGNKGFDSPTMDLIFSKA
jgi:hypothetical protein